MFPELAAIAAGMCLQTGNAVGLRGSAEASHTNAAIAQVLQCAIADSHLPNASVVLASADQGISVQNLVSQEQYLNLVIPYGRASFVQQVLNWSAVPALRTAIGNCYLYCAATGDLDLARSMITESHASEPDPVNAIEKVLLHSSLDTMELTRLFSGLREAGFTLQGEVELAHQFPDYLQPVRRETEWREAYLKRVVSFRCVTHVEDAIAWINGHSNHHADCLVTRSYAESRLFAQQVNSALLYINTSPRFSRNPQQTQQVYLGVSNHKGQRRGLIGVDSLMAFNQVIQG
jgi:glutamate-5-semialdehyde dehydrogenase